MVVVAVDGALYGTLQNLNHVNRRAVTEVLFFPRAATKQKLF